MGLVFGVGVKVRLCCTWQACVVFVCELFCCEICLGTLGSNMHFALRKQIDTVSSCNCSAFVFVL